MAKHKTHYEECDVLVVGGGMAGTGATFEARHWGRDLKIVCVEKANIDRSGAVAQGLYAYKPWATAPLLSILAFSTQTIFRSLPQCLASKVAPVPAIPPPTTKTSHSS